MNVTKSTNNTFQGIHKSVPKTFYPFFKHTNTNPQTRKLVDILTKHNVALSYNPVKHILLLVTSAWHQL